MADQIFLSYKRAKHTTPVAERLRDRIEVQISGAQTFFDQSSIDAGGLWADAIDTFLAQATAFVGLISVDYWRSEQCQRELEIALTRYEATQPPRPRMLFILAETLAPSDLSIKPLDALADITKNGDAAPHVQRIRSLGQFNFLGPYDESGRLVRLAFEEPYKLDDQIAAMVKTIKSLLAGS